MIKKSLKNIIIISMFLSCNGCCSQHSNNDKSDLKANRKQELKNNETIVPDKDITIKPKGSQILNKSHKSFKFYNLTGLWLSFVDFVECKQNNSKPIDDLVNSIQLTDSTMDISISFYSRCSSDYLFEVELVEEVTVNIIYHGYNSLADCRCEYNATYLFTNKDYKEGLSMDNNNLKYISVNGGEKHLISNFFGK